jgi:hypothetical protein
MQAILAAIFDELTTDAQLLAFWAAAPTPEGQEVRIHWDLPDRDEALPYVVWIAKALGGESMDDVPLEEVALWFSVYDFKSSDTRCVAICDRIRVMLSGRVWNVATTSATAARTFKASVALPVPTGSKESVRRDFKVPLRFYDCVVADAVTGGLPR